MNAYRKNIVGWIDDNHPAIPEPGKPRVAIFACFDERYAPLAEIAEPNWKRYAERHGYMLRFYEGGFHLDLDQPETYGDKIRFQHYYDLRGFADIIMYLDIDSLFMHMDTKVEDWVEPPPEDPEYPGHLVRNGICSPIRFFWTYDDNGPCSGLWIARTDSVTEKHLRFAYERAAVESHVRNGRIEPGGISDQDSMRDLMNIPPFWDTFRMCFPAEAVGHCSEATYAPGKWIIQFGGMSLDEKVKRMKHYAGLA